MQVDTKDIKAVKDLIEKAASRNDIDDALKLSQAALNMAQALTLLNNIQVS